MATFQNTNITTKRDVSIHLLFLILAWGMAVVSCRKDELDIDITCESPCEPLLKALSFKASFYKYTWPNYDVWGNYQNEVQNLKHWLNERMEWLKREYDRM